MRRSRNNLLAVCVVMGLIAPVAMMPAPASAQCRIVFGSDGWSTSRFPRDFGSPVTFAVNPENPQRMYVAASGRLDLSTDGGCTWNKVWPKAPGPAIASLTLGADADGREVLYMRGTGLVSADDCAGCDGDLFHRQGWLLASTDGAKTWNFATGLPRRANLLPYAWEVEVSQSNPQVAYATATEAPFSGSNETVTVLAVTKDGGANWEALPSPPARLASITVEPRDPQHLWGVAYAAHTHYVGGATGREPAERLEARLIVRSTDGGKSWKEVETLPNHLILQSKTLQGEIQSFQPPGGPPTLVLPTHAAGDLLLSLSVSSDAGKTWRSYVFPWRAQQIQSAFAVDPSGTRIGVAFAGIDAEVYVLNLQARRWEVFKHEPTSVFRALSTDRAPRPFLYGLTFEGINKRAWQLPGRVEPLQELTLDHGKPGRCAGVIKRGGGWQGIKVAPFHKHVITASDGTELANHDHHEIKVLTVDKVDARRIYVSDGKTVLRTNDGGCSWDKIYELPYTDDGSLKDPTAHMYDPAGSRVRGLWTGPTAATRDRVYMVVTGPQAPMSDEDGTAELHMLVSSNGGDKFEHQEDGLGGADNNTRVTNASVAIPRSDPDYVYLQGDTAFYRSKNGGRSWEKQSPGGGFGIVLDPTNRDVVWRWSPGKVSISRDGGVNFNPVNDVSGTGSGGVIVQPTPDGLPTVILESQPAGCVKHCFSRSDDGGRSWYHLPQPIAVSHHSALPESIAGSNDYHFVGPGEVVLVGRPDLGAGFPVFWKGRLSPLGAQWKSIEQPYHLVAPRFLASDTSFGQTTTDDRGRFYVIAHWSYVGWGETSSQYWKGKDLGFNTIEVYKG